MKAAITTILRYLAAAILAFVLSLITIFILAPLQWIEDRRSNRIKRGPPP